MTLHCASLASVLSPGTGGGCSGKCYVLVSVCPALVRFIITVLG